MLTKFEEFLRENKEEYGVFNETDGVYISPDTYSKEQAEQAKDDFINRYKKQGYYKTSSGERIKPEDIVLTVKKV